MSLGLEIIAIKAIPAAVDLALFAIDLDQAPAAVERCIRVVQACQEPLTRLIYLRNEHVHFLKEKHPNELSQCDQTIDAANRGLLEVAALCEQCRPDLSGATGLGQRLKWVWADKKQFESLSPLIARQHDNVNTELMNLRQLVRLMDVLGHINGSGGNGAVVGGPGDPSASQAGSAGPATPPAGRATTNSAYANIGLLGDIMFMSNPANFSPPPPPPYTPGVGGRASTIPVTGFANLNLGQGHSQSPESRMSVSSTEQPTGDSQTTPSQQAQTSADTTPSQAGSSIPLNSIWVGTSSPRVAPTPATMRAGFTASPGSSSTWQGPTSNPILNTQSSTIAGQPATGPHTTPPTTNSLLGQNQSPSSRGITRPPAFLSGASSFGVSQPGSTSPPAGSSGFQSAIYSHPQHPSTLSQHSSSLYSNVSTGNANTGAQLIQPMIGTSRTQVGVAIPQSGSNFPPNTAQQPPPGQTLLQPTIYQGAGSFTPIVQGQSALQPGARQSWEQNTRLGLSVAEGPTASTSGQPLAAASNISPSRGAQGTSSQASFSSAIYKHPAAARQSTGSGPGLGGSARATSTELPNNQASITQQNLVSPTAGSGLSSSILSGSFSKPAGIYQPMPSTTPVGATATRAPSPPRQPKVPVSAAPLSTIPDSMIYNQQPATTFRPAPFLAPPSVPAKASSALPVDNMKPLPAPPVDSIQCPLSSNSLSNPVTSAAPNASAAAFAPFLPSSAAAFSPPSMVTSPSTSVAATISPQSTGTGRQSSISYTGTYTSWQTWDPAPLPSATATLTGSAASAGAHDAAGPGSSGTGGNGMLVEAPSGRLAYAHGYTTANRYGTASIVAPNPPNGVYEIGSENYYAAGPAGRVELA